MSDDYRGMHQNAVAATINAMGELQERLAAATEQCDVVIGVVLSATAGADIESANNALNFIVLCRENVREGFRQTNVATDEMRRYGQGF